MPGPRTPRQRPVAVSRRRGRRIRRVVLLAVVLGALAVTLSLTAFGSGSVRPAQPPRTIDAPLFPAGPPRPQVIALQGQLRIQLPVAQRTVTAVGYHASSEGALPLQPLGRRGNRGFLSRVFHEVFGDSSTGLRWYQLPGGTGAATGVLDVGAPVGTDVYAPVDGTVVALTDYVLDGRAYGQRVDIQPAGAPSLVVSLTHLRADPGLTVGSTLASGRSKVGSVIDLAGVERQALAAHTDDAGNHVALEVHPTGSLSLR